MTAPQLLYTTDEAAARLAVSASWLKKAAQARTVPCRRMGPAGRLVRFSEADLAAIIAASEDRPVRAASPLGRAG